MQQGDVSRGILRSDKHWLNRLREQGVDVMEVLNEPQVLLDDDWLIAESWNLSYESAVLEKREGEQVITCDKPWEGTMSFTWAMYEQEEKTFKLWYSAIVPGKKTNVCYATSKDGIHFDKPKLGLVEFDGSRENNIVFQGTDAVSVLKDFSEPDPSRRYKMGYDKIDHRGCGLAIATSPDGLQWTAAQYTAIHGHEFDSHNVILFDEQRGEFVMYIRFWLYGKRQVRRATSPDCFHWSQPEWVEGPDDADPMASDIYTPAVCKYSEAPNVWVMQTSFFDHPSNQLWIQLALSRNGIHWKRYRKPFVERGPEGAWDCGSHYAVPAVMLHDEKLWVYYKAHDVGHVGAVPGGGVGVGTMRRDGFIAITAGQHEGVLTTKLLAFSHDGPATPNKGRLTINCDATGGCVRVELVDISGAPISGFTKQDCDPITTDSTLHIVSWQSKRAIDHLMGVPLRLRFYMENAKLYSFRFLAYGTIGTSFDDPEEQRLYDLDQIDRNH